MDLTGSPRFPSGSEARMAWAVPSGSVAGRAGRSMSSSHGTVRPALSLGLSRGVRPGPVRDLLGTFPRPFQRPVLRPFPGGPSCDPFRAARPGPSGGLLPRPFPATFSRGLFPGPIRDPFPRLPITDSDGWY